MPEIHPFTSTLIEASQWQRPNMPMQDIFYLENNPDIIVRATFEGEYNGIRDNGSFVEHVTNRKVLNALSNEYGLSIPSVNMVVGGNNRIYTITDRIHGSNLYEKVFNPSEISTAKQKLQSFYSSLADVYIDTSENGGPMIADLTRAGADTSGNKQWVYGKRKGEKEDQIWLVDLGPAIHTFLPRQLLFFQRQFPGLIEMILESEEKVGVKFEEARNKVVNYLSFIKENMETTNPSQSYTKKEIENFLRLHRMMGHI
jgi:hypothetical protein